MKNGSPAGGRFGVAPVAARRGAAGLGLVELLVVTVILLVLGGFLYTRLLGGKTADGQKRATPTQRARQVEGAAYIGQINQAIAMYKMDHDGQNPPDLAALKRYGVSESMTKDPNTGQTLPYDPQTGRVGAPGGGSALPRVPGY